MKLRYILRFVMVFLFSIIAFRILDNNTIGFLFLIGLLTTIIICVFIGDGFLLPTFGLITSSIIEGILATILVFIIDLMSSNFNSSLFNYLIFSLLLIFFECLYHSYLFSKERIIL